MKDLYIRLKLSETPPVFTPGGDTAGGAKDGGGGLLSALVYIHVPRDRYYPDPAPGEGWGARSRDGSDRAGGCRARCAGGRIGGDLQGVPARSGQVHVPTVFNAILRASLLQGTRHELRRVFPRRELRRRPEGNASRGRRQKANDGDTRQVRQAGRGRSGWPRRRAGCRRRRGGRGRGGRGRGVVVVGGVHPVGGQPRKVSQGRGAVRGGPLPRGAGGFRTLGGDG